MKVNSILYQLMYMTWEGNQGKSLEEEKRRGRSAKWRETERKRELGEKEKWKGI